MSSGAQGTRMSTSRELTPSEREHLHKDHLQFSVVGKRLQMTFVQQCGNTNDNACPLPEEFSIFMCKHQPCPG